MIIRGADGATVHALITALDHDGLIRPPPDCIIPADAPFSTTPSASTMNSPQPPAPTISQITAQMHREITDHITAGTVPASVSNLPQLRCYLDVNALAREMTTEREQLTGQPVTEIVDTVGVLLDAWLRAGRPTVLVTSIRPSPLAEHDTEIELSNGIRILAAADGVLVTTIDHRVLSFLDVIDPDQDHDHLDLAIDTPTTTH
ncbi:hypothetical protein ACWEQA_24115 [Nocardia sp. NPDC004085]